MKGDVVVWPVDEALSLPVLTIFSGETSCQSSLASHRFRGFAIANLIHALIGNSSSPINCLLQQGENQACQVPSK